MARKTHFLRNGESRWYPFRDMDDVRRANAELGHYFFSKDTLSFFASRVHESLYGGRYFVTSEQYRDHRGSAARRLYTVREVLPDGSCETVGEFQEYGTRDAAHRAAQRLAEEFATA